jgi:transketolase
MKNNLATAFAKSCRKSALEMVVNSQSGHPGGSLSCIDFLSLLYLEVINKTGERVIISNGHISPAVYSILGHLKYFPLEDAILGFRKFRTEYEGHVNPKLPGVIYGTGPLGVGVSVAAGIAMSDRSQRVFAVMGDGEAQEGQVHEMMHFASAHKLGNLVIFIDKNDVQLSSCIKNISNLNVTDEFKAAGWDVKEIDGHNFSQIRKSLEVRKSGFGNKPLAIIGQTVMGKGFSLMEKAGLEKDPKWHGKAPSKNTDLSELNLSKNEKAELDKYFKSKDFKSRKKQKTTKPNKVIAGNPMVYSEPLDCRSAYGNALKDLASLNKNVMALTADLASSVKMCGVKSSFPDRFIECGIAEQNMLSVAAGLNIGGSIPFVSTFGVFMTSRARDQIRVNDINRIPVKMVATHCGLSVGEDGPTHQAIDDIGSIRGLMNTKVLEPVDANHCDKLTRMIALNNDSFYMRMGRHKLPIILDEDGEPFYGKKYKAKIGKSDIIRKGSDIVLIATGALVNEAILAKEVIEKEEEVSIAVVAVSSYEKMDSNLSEVLENVSAVFTIEDHNPETGLGSWIASEVAINNRFFAHFEMLGVKKYMGSGDVKSLYKAAGIDAKSITKRVLSCISL